MNNMQLQLVGELVYLLNQVLTAGPILLVIVYCPIVTVLLNRRLIPVQKATIIVTREQVFLLLRI